MEPIPLRPAPVMNVFGGWEPLGRIALVGPLAYLAMVVLLRVSGKRTLSKMNAFDFVVTISLGSALAAVIIDPDVALAEGVAVFAVLIGGQLLVTFLSVRVPWIENLVKSSPTLLFHDGQYLAESMRRCRVTEPEVEAAVRQAGLPGLDHVATVVLETDGSVSVVGGSSQVAP